MPPSSLEDDAIEELIGKFRGAKEENYAFGLVAERLFNWLILYNKGDEIPDKYWDEIQSLANSVEKDPTGKLVFTEKQSAVMKILNHAMKIGGLVITVPERDITYQILLLSLKDFSEKELLESAFFPSILEKCGQDVDPFYFTVFFVEGMIKSLEIVNTKGGYFLGLEDIVTQYYPCKLVETFWGNPEIVKYLKEFLYKAVL